MAVDPRIALAFQAPQIQQRDTAQEYGQLMQLQNAMLQGQQLRREAEQEQGITNYLAQANIGTPEGRAGLRKFGKTGLAYEKLLSEQETNALKRQELEGKVREQRMQALGTGLISVLPDPSDQNLGMAFDRLDAVGVDTTPFRQQFAGITDINQRKTLLNQYVTSNKEGREALAFVQPKPVLVDQHGKKVLVDQNPASPTYLKELKEYGVTMTPYEVEQTRQGRQRIGIEERKARVAEEEARQKRDPEFQQRMAYGKAMGEAAAKGDFAAKQEFPKVVAQAQEAVGLIDQMIGQRDAKGNLVKGAAPHPGFTGSVGAGLGLRFVPGTSEANFQALYDQVKSGAFLQAFNALRGAGAITEKEGEKATAAITRMSLAQDEKEFVKAALEFQDSVKAGAARAQQKVLGAGGGVRPSAPATPPPARPSVSPNIDALLDKYK